MRVLLITQLLRFWEGLALVNRFKHTSWVAVVTSTDRRKSFRNRCVIKVFMDFGFFVGVFPTFVIGLSQISSFFSFNRDIDMIGRMHERGNRDLTS